MNSSPRKFNPSTLPPIFLYTVSSFLLSFLLFTSTKLESSIAFHEFHMSSCEIEFAEEEETVQITLHIFIDDLELALSKRGIDSLFLCTNREAEDSEIHIADYINHVLQISLDGQPIQTSIIGKEVSDDLAAVWCYFESERVVEPAEISVTYTLLTEVFDDQRNIVKINYSDDKRAYFLFDNKEYKGDLVISEK